MQPFYVTQATVVITGPAGATSTSPSGTATATIGGTGPGSPGSVTVTASGQGSVAVALYSGNPTGDPTLPATGLYFDIHVANGSSFTAITLAGCDYAPGTNHIPVIQWLPTGIPISPVTYDPASGCVTMIFSPTSTPNLSQLDGTIFVLIHVDLKLSVTVSPSTATTGTTVTVSAALTSVASVARRVTVTGTFTYTSPNGRRFSFSLPTLSGTVGAGQTFARSFSFKVASFLPRGTYTLVTTASDLLGSVMSTSALTIT